jgi:hypothetical protein
MKVFDIEDVPQTGQQSAGNQKRDGFLVINYNYGRPVIEYGQIGTHSDE